MSKLFRVRTMLRPDDDFAADPHDRLTPATPTEWRCSICHRDWWLVAYKKEYGPRLRCFYCAGMLFPKPVSSRRRLRTTFCPTIQAQAIAKELAASRQAIEQEQAHLAMLRERVGSLERPTSPDRHRTPSASSGGGRPSSGARMRSVLYIHDTPAALWREHDGLTWLEINDHEIGGHTLVVYGNSEHVRKLLYDWLSVLPEPWLLSELHGLLERWRRRVRAETAACQTAVRECVDELEALLSRTS